MTSMEAVLETGLKSDGLLVRPVSIKNEKHLDEQQGNEKSSEECQRNIFIKSEPVDVIEPRVGEKVNQTDEPAAAECQEHNVKFEPILNEVRDLLDHEPPNKNAEGEPQAMSSDFDMTGDIDYMSDIKKEVLDDCAQATCENLVETIEQHFEEIDEMIFGNLESRNGFKKETLRRSIEMVELEQSEEKRGDDPKKLNLKDVLKTVDRFERSNTSEIKPEETDKEESIVLEDYTSGSETDSYCCDSDRDVDKTKDETIETTIDNDSDRDVDGTKDEAIETTIDNDSDSDVDKTKDEAIETTIDNESIYCENDSKETDKALLEKFNISECCVHLMVIDKSLTVEGYMANVKNSETEKVNQRNDKQHERLKRGSVQCKVCSMNMKNVKSLLIHSRIHLKFNLMCCFCGPLHTYYTVAGLEKHMAKHGKSPLECKICGRILPNERKLKYHGIKHGIKSFNCNLCPKAYYSVKRLEDHLRTHSNEHPYTCSLCSLSFTSSTRLGQHTANCHGNQERKYLCKVCGKGFKRKEHMKRHISHVHSNARPYVCKICGKSYKGRGSLSLHNRSHTGEKVICDVCGRTFRDPGDLKKHKKVVHDKIKNFKCDSCGLLFANQSNLMVHIKHRHSDPSTIVKKFKCEQCDWSFDNRSALKIHMKKHIETTNYKCPHCEKCFKCKDYLEKHVTIHYRSNERLSCPECPQTFTAKEGLRKHMKFHKFGRQYKCKTCKATFIHKNHLERHTKYAHMGIKHPRYQCQICGKHVGKLKLHLESHNQEKPHRCEECGRGFRSAIRLEIHSRTHWDTKPFNCRMCDTAFTRYDNYKAHLKRVHDKTVDDKEDSSEEDDSDASESE